jgi:hypothetical protein
MNKELEKLKKENDDLEGKFLQERSNNKILNHMIQSYNTNKLNTQGPDNIC